MCIYVCPILIQGNFQMHAKSWLFALGYMKQAFFSPNLFFFEVT